MYIQSNIFNKPSDDRIFTLKSNQLFFIINLNFFEKDNQQFVLLLGSKRRGALILTDEEVERLPFVTSEHV